jgi:hypothetical protein
MRTALMLALLLAIASCGSTPKSGDAPPPESRPDASQSVEEAGLPRQFSDFLKSCPLTFATTASTGYWGWPACRGRVCVKFVPAAQECGGNCTFYCKTDRDCPPQSFCDESTTTVPEYFSNGAVCRPGARGKPAPGPDPCGR